MVCFCSAHSNNSIHLICMHVHPYVYMKRSKKKVHGNPEQSHYLYWVCQRCAEKKGGRERGYNIISSYMSNNNNIKITENKFAGRKFSLLVFISNRPHQYMMFFPFLVLILNDEKNVLIITCCIVIVRNALLSYQWL